MLSIGTQKNINDKKLMLFLNLRVGIASFRQNIKTLALNVILSCQLLGIPESIYYERIIDSRPKLN